MHSTTLLLYESYILHTPSCVDVFFDRGYARHVRHLHWNSLMTRELSCVLIIVVSVGALCPSPTAARHPKPPIDCLCLTRGRDAHTSGNHFDLQYAAAFANSLLLSSILVSRMNNNNNTAAQCESAAASACALRSRATGPHCSANCSRAATSSTATCSGRRCHAINIRLAGARYAQRVRAAAAPHRRARRPLVRRARRLRTHARRRRAARAALLRAARFHSRVAREDGAVAQQRAFPRRQMLRDSSLVDLSELQFFHLYVAAELGSFDRIAASYAVQTSKLLRRRSCQALWGCLYNGCSSSTWNAAIAAACLCPSRSTSTCTTPTLLIGSCFRSAPKRRSLCAARASKTKSSSSTGGAGRSSSSRPSTRQMNSIAWFPSQWKNSILKLLHKQLESGADLNGYCILVHAIYPSSSETLKKKRRVENTTSLMYLLYLMTFSFALLVQAPSELNAKLKFAMFPRVP